MSWFVSAALLAFLAAHVASWIGLVRARVGWKRIVVSALVAPLVPWWAWEAGLERRVLAWLGALVLYAVGVAIA